MGNRGRRRTGRVLASDEVFRGRVFRVVRESVLTPGGRTVGQDILVHPGAAVIVPLPDPDHVVLVRQYRHAAREFLWEVPAGRLEKGEDGLRAAQRELREEVGMTARRWRSLGGFFPAPGYTTEFMHLFAATRLERDPAAAPPPDEDEEIEVGLFPLARVRRLIRSGAIRDGKTIVAISFCGGE